MPHMQNGTTHNKTLIQVHQINTQLTDWLTPPWRCYRQPEYIKRMSYPSNIRWTGEVDNNNITNSRIIKITKVAELIAAVQMERILRTGGRVSSH